ncbi:MAG TPA: hypothetical protein VG692_13315 [Gemmatimonadales bacterium]|nr:hypothetical protein [Gemmatimonadales bacterium]
MRLLPLATLLLVTATAAPRLAAQDIVADVEYFTGKGGFEEKQKGMLVLSAEGIKFADKNGGQIFDIPMVTITQVERSTDIRDASVGKKLLFGSLAGSRKQEFLTITTESESTAEAVVFKLKQNTGAAALAKINFYRKKAGATIPDAPDSASTRSNPQPPR